MTEDPNSSLLPCALHYESGLPTLLKALEQSATNTAKILYPTFKEKEIHLLSNEVLVGLNQCAFNFHAYHAFSHTPCLLRTRAALCIP